MEFGPIPVSGAVGAILAHTVRAGGSVLKKGRVLSAADTAILAEAGHGEIVAARLTDGDIAEDEAARRIAVALAGAEVRIGAAFTGRANLYAEAAGIAVVDQARIRTANAIDEAITIATLAPFASVATRQMVATVKIIPFAAPAEAVTAAEDALRGTQPPITVAPFRPKRAALLSTALAGTKPALAAKNGAALASRLGPLGSTIMLERSTRHDIQELAEAIRDAKAEGADPILIFGASAITDRRDVIPAALEAAGGVVTHFGMPVDPGNLLLLGQLGNATVIGLPGCARSPKLNGFDFVLQRVLADIPISADDVAAMGVGGLLTEIHSRPQPRDRPATHTNPHAPKIAAVVLAAGLSSRMGRNKLAVELGGKPILRHVVDAALASSARPVIVVTGSEAGAIERMLEGLPVFFVQNPNFRNGLSTSLIQGINAVPDDCDGALVLLGDMPGVTAGLLDKLIAAFDPEDGRPICVASHQGRRGNPVLWGRQFFPDICKLEGDTGAKAILAANTELLCEVEAADDGPLLDIDTPDALVAYRARMSS